MAQAASDRFSSIFGEGRGSERPDPSGRPRPGTPGFSAEGLELSDGGVLEWPEDDGLIRLRDADGDSLYVWRIGDEGWEERAHIFGVCAKDFEEPEDD
jgi:hypothetical protein